MVTAFARRTLADEPQTHLETRLSVTLERHFRTLRERIPAMIENQGCLPITFWMQERDAMVAVLMPILGEGLRCGVERELQRPRFPAERLLLNANAHLWQSALHMACELAQRITLAAAECLDSLRPGLQTEIALEDLRLALREGPLSDANAQVMGVRQAGRTLHAGRLLAQRAQFSEGNLRESSPLRLCI